MPERPRAAITGIGLLTPCGLTRDETWKSLVQGKSGIDTVTSFDVSEFKSHIAGELKGFDPLNWIDKRETRRMDRFSMIGIATADQAFEDSGIEVTDENRDRIGVITGSGVGGQLTVEHQLGRHFKGGPSRISPMTIPNQMINALSGNISMRLKVRGPNCGIVSACASGSHAIGYALRILQMGEADVVITGGSEAPVTILGMGGFCAAKALSTRNDAPQEASRPFDLDRDGFVMAEGAGMLVIERMDLAKERGARIYAELAGFGETGDGYHLTQPAPGGEGGARAMKKAMADAGLTSEDISYVNAHGTSTKYNDSTETQAIKTAFGNAATSVMVSSTKSMTGHMLGAAGGVEAGLCALAIQSGVVPPTTNYTTPDPECDLDYVPNQAREAEITAAMSNSLGFGGHNASLVIKKI